MGTLAPADVVANEQLGRDAIRVSERRVVYSTVMIGIATLPSLSEAYVLESLLELENINVFIPDEVMGGDVVELMPSPVQVQVAEEDVERALKIAEGFPQAKVSTRTRNRPPIKTDAATNGGE